jgi:hypothetical protein
VVAWFLIAAVQGAQTPVMLELPAQAPCALSTALPLALADENLVVAKSPLKLSVAPRQGVIAVALSDHGVVRATRELDFAAEDCPVLPQVIATLARAWVDRTMRAAALAVGPRRAPVAPAPEPEPAVEPESTSTVAPVATPVAQPEPTAPVALAAPVVEPESTPTVAPAAKSVVEPEATPLVAPAPTAAAEPAASAPARSPAPTPLKSTPAPELASSAPAPSPVGSHSLSVLAMAGVSVAPSDVLVASGRGAVEVGIREPWGLALEFGADSPRSIHTASDLTLDARLIWAGLEGRYALFLGHSRGLYFITGVRLEVLSISFAGPLVQPITNVPDVTAAATAAIEYRHTLGEGFFAVARLGAELRPGAISFTLTAQNLMQSSFETFSLPPWGFTLNLGLGWRALF